MGAVIVVLRGLAGHARLTRDAQQSSRVTQRVQLRGDQPA
jgi:hypothetical protein